MIGEYLGVATLLKVEYPLVKRCYSMAHRLELAVKKVVDDVNAVSYFRTFVDALHKIYSLSVKKIKGSCKL